MVCRLSAANTTMQIKYTFSVLLLLLAAACSKEKLAEKKAEDPGTLSKIFEDYILNKDIRVNLARFEGRDTTALLSAYTFKLLKDTYYQGPFTAVQGSDTFSGNWQSNEDYSKLILDIKQNSALEWISISWKFKSKTVSTLELIPWFTTDGDKYVRFQK